MEGTRSIVDNALGRLAVEDPGRAELAAECHSLLVEGGGSQAFSRFIVQGFLWYVVPRRWPPAERQGATEALARLLELCGLERYAELCRSPETAAVLAAYRRGTARGHTRARWAEIRSGVCPSDLEELSWSASPTKLEREAFLHVSGTLEVALLAGEIHPGTPGWLDRRLDIARACLGRPSPEVPGRTRLEAVLYERIDRWLEAGCSYRRTLLEPLAPGLVEVTPTPDDLSGLEPLTWLLGKTKRGLRTKRDGDPPARIAGEAQTLFGLNGELGPEQPVGLLLTVLEALGLLHRSGRTLRATPPARWMAEAPGELWRAVARSVWTAPTPRNAAAELVLASLLTEGPERESTLAARIHPMLQAALASPLPLGETARYVRYLVWLGEPLGVLRADGSWQGVRPSADRVLHLTDLGRATATEALRSRATLPSG